MHFAKNSPKKDIKPFETNALFEEESSQCDQSNDTSLINKDSINADFPAEM